MKTREQIKQEYEQLTGKSPHLLNLNDGELSTTDYVSWLEDNLLNQINKKDSNETNYSGGCTLRSFDCKFWKDGGMCDAKESKEIEKAKRKVVKAVLNELQLKLIGMQTFASEEYNEIAYEGASTVFDEIRAWINKHKEAGK